MIRLSEPADLGDDTNVRKICLPFIAFNYPQSWSEMASMPTDDDDLSNGDYIPERDNNYLRSIRLRSNRTRPTNASLISRAKRKSGRPAAAARRTSKRRNDKFLHDKRPFNIAQRSSNQIQVICEHFTIYFFLN